MHQIGVDICRLPEVDGFNYLVVCIDYFTKWSEAKPLKEKAAHFVAQFLYEVICRHVYKYRSMTKEESSLMKLIAIFIV